MPQTDFLRRDVLATLLAALPLPALDWDALPDAKPSAKDPDQFDAVIVGSGLGGLSCAAAFARKGYRPLVVEQHDKPGGYATAFQRPGGFTFDVSLHSTSVGERNGIRNLIDGFPEISDVEFVPHPHLYRAVFPEHDIRVKQRDVAGYQAMLARLFPAEAAGIEALVGDMRNLASDINRISKARAPVDMSRFPVDFPTLARCASQTWGAMVDYRIRDPKLKALVSVMWVYYGLPPSRLATFYYALPTLGYLEAGGYYPKGRSQTISDALVKLIEARGGKVLLGTRVERILVKDGAAYGVLCAGGRKFHARAVVSNASAWTTFHQLLETSKEVEEYKARMAAFSVSLSSFQVFLGLKKDLAKDLSGKDTEIFVEPGYDLEASYEAARKADVANCGMCVTLYDNLFPGYSPKGKNTVNVLALQGFDHWKKFESDYWKGQKSAYHAEKERMAEVMIRRAEQAVLPGLAKAIEVRSSAHRSPTCATRGTTAAPSTDGIKP